MSILTKIGDYFKNKRIKNQNKVYEQAHKLFLEYLETDGMPTEILTALSQASNYETLLAAIDNMVLACQYAIQKGSIGNINEFKGIQSLLIKLRLIITFFSGSIGFLWL